MYADHYLLYVTQNLLESMPIASQRKKICLRLIKDYSSGILLDANENSMGPAVSTHEHLALNRFVGSGLSMNKHTTGVSILAFNFTLIILLMKFKQVSRSTSSRPEERNCQIEKCSERANIFRCGQR